jgi:hypothetical protein
MHKCQDYIALTKQSKMKTHVEPVQKNEMRHCPVSIQLQRHMSHIARYQACDAEGHSVSLDE